jgi:hypothetical protein
MTKVTSSRTSFKMMRESKRKKEGLCVRRDAHFYGPHLEKKKRMISCSEFT